MAGSSGVRDGRAFAPSLVAQARATDSGRVEILAPGVGYFRDAPGPGAVVRPGDTLGLLEVLGVAYRVIVPEQAGGVVCPPGQDDRPFLARRPVGHGDGLLVLDPAGSPLAGEQFAGASGEAQKTGRIAFRSPMGGRYYSRPGPGKPPFVSAGDEIAVGTTVCLLEVMKTFNRVTYGGAGLPERARVAEIMASDDDDLGAGDVILYLES